MSDVILSFVVPQQRIREVKPLLMIQDEEGDDFWTLKRKREIQFAYMHELVEVQVLCGTNVRETQKALEAHFGVPVSADTLDRVFAPRVIRRRETPYWIYREKDIPEVKDIYVWFVYDWTKTEPTGYNYLHKLYRITREWIPYTSDEIPEERLGFIDGYVLTGGVDDTEIDFVSTSDARHFEGYYDTICSARKDGGNYAGDTYDRMVERYIESLVCNGEPTYVDLFIDEKRRNGT